MPHLGCSPDRRVYDPSANPPWVLFEIKCSMNEVKDVEYLQKYPTTGAYSLKRNHKHYQLIGCLGLTGEVWSEFFVQCKKEFHYVKEYITMLSYSLR